MLCCVRRAVLFLVVGVQLRCLFHFADMGSVLQIWGLRGAGDGCATCLPSTAGGLYADIHVTMCKVSKMNRHLQVPPLKISQKCGYFTFPECEAAVRTKHSVQWGWLWSGQGDAYGSSAKVYGVPEHAPENHPHRNSPHLRIVTSMYDAMRDTVWAPHPAPLAPSNSTSCGTCVYRQKL